MKKRVLFSALLLAIALTPCLAQQDPHFSHYMLNSMAINPAYAGLENKTQISLLHRSQWAGYQPSFGNGGAPTTQFVTLSMPLLSINSGIGGIIVYDQLGAQTNMQARVGFSHHYRIGKKVKISVGILGGLYSYALNFGELRYIDPNDALLKDRSGTQSQIKPDLSAGIWVSSDKFYGGVSIQHILPSKFDLGSTQIYTLQKHLIATAGYLLAINFDFNIQFSALLTTDLIHSSIDLSSILNHKSGIWGGLSFRESEAAVLLLGGSLLKSKALKIGYGLDYVIFNRKAKQYTSHEIFLRYEIPANLLRKKPIRTPRFRY